MPFTAAEIQRAFAECSASDSSLDEYESEDSPMESTIASPIFVLRCPKGPGGGYIRVWGPNAQPPAPRTRSCYVIIECFNGVVGVRSELVPFLAGVVPRNSNATIAVDPLGYGCGPKYGLYEMAIGPASMGPGAMYPTPAALAQAIIQAFAKAGLRW